MTASAKPSTSTTRPSRKAAPSRRRAVTLAGRTARDTEIVVVNRPVPAPYAPGTFETASVNRRVDVLADERSKGRISEAAFLVGRMIQAVYERGSGARLGSGGWDIAGSRDQTVAHELAIIYALEDAERVRKFTARLEQAVGSVGARFLRAILAEGKTFTSYAADRGRSGERAVGEIAQRFRWLLEALVEAQHTATGAEGQRVRGVRTRP